MTNQTVTEWCPHCEHEVELKTINERQPCSNCKELIAPCAQFSHDRNDTSSPLCVCMSREETKYNLIDTCNNDEVATETTLEGAKMWLLDFWANDDDMTEEEFREYAAELNGVDNAHDLHEYLQGIGYAIEELE